MSYWHKLNYLVPEPQCSTKGNEITEWHDQRPQPSDADINAVDMNLVNARIKDENIERLMDGEAIIKALITEMDSLSPGFRGRLQTNLR